MINYISFIKESNKIEGINRDPTAAETTEFFRFMKLKSVTLKDLIQFVGVYQPNAELRDRPGINVQIGGYLAPKGDITIRTRLEDIIEDANTIFPEKLDRGPSAYGVHVRYELLHPFTDGNGRSGRMLWAWMMKDFPLGFLHIFYYQALSAARM
jgi:hypothetical protein